MAQHMTQDTFSQRTVSRVEHVLPKAIFVGDSLGFSDRILTVYRAEFPDFEFMRVADISDVAVARRLHDDVRLVIFEADQMQPALDNPNRFADAAGSAKIIFSLLDPQDAAQFLAARGDKPALDNVGFLPLNAQMDVWISVMHLFLCGQSFLPREVADALIGNSVQSDTKDTKQALTAREWEVLELVAKGTQNKIIAADLDLSVHTVKLHIHNLLKKIGVSNRTCAAGWYMQHRGGTSAGMHGGS